MWIARPEVVILSAVLRMHLGATYALSRHVREVTVVAAVPAVVEVVNA